MARKSKASAGKAPAAKRKAAKKPKSRNSLSAYARLVRDPCNASLALGPAIGVTGGFVSRFQTNYTFGTTAGQDTVLLGLFPTAITTSGTDGTPQVFRASAVKWAGGTNSGGSFVSGGGLMNQINGWCPGSSWLENNARRYRPLAACLQIMCTTNANTVQGLLFAGKCTHDDMGGSNPNINAFLDSANRVCKASGSGLEVVWRPNEESILPFNMGSARPNGDDDGIYVGGTGLALASGATVRLTVVWEWWPLLSNAAKSDQSATTNTTYFRRVLDEMAKWEPGWFVRLLNHGAPVAAGLLMGP